MTTSLPFTDKDMLCLSLTHNFYPTLFLVPMSCYVVSCHWDVTGCRRYVMMYYVHNSANVPVSPTWANSDKNVYVYKSNISFTSKTLRKTKVSFDPVPVPGVWVWEYFQTLRNLTWTPSIQSSHTQEFCKFFVILY